MLTRRLDFATTGVADSVLGVTQLTRRPLAPGLRIA
jgi:hypothetical protein